MLCRLLWSFLRLWIAPRIEDFYFNALHRQYAMKLTSSYIQALHRQHPIIIGCIVEPAFQNRIVGQLFENFNCLILLTSFVKCCENEQRIQKYLNKSPLLKSEKRELVFYLFEPALPVGKILLGTYFSCRRQFISARSAPLLVTASLNPLYLLCFLHWIPFTLILSVE